MIAGVVILITHYATHSPVMYDTSARHSYFALAGSVPGLIVVIGLLTASFVLLSIGAIRVLRETVRKLAIAAVVCVLAIPTVLLALFFVASRQGLGGPSTVALFFLMYFSVPFVALCLIFLTIQIVRAQLSFDQKGYLLGISLIAASLIVIYGLTPLATHLLANAFTGAGGAFRAVATLVVIAGLVWISPAGHGWEKIRHHQ